MSAKKVIRGLLKSGDSSKGMALMIVLMILMVLAVLVHQFTFSTKVEIASAANIRDDFQAECLAFSGIQAAVAILANEEEPEVNHYGQRWALIKGSQDTTTEGSFADTDRPEGDFGLTIRDESGKIDLSSLLQADEEADPFLYAQMVSLLDMFDLTEDRMDTLLDWLDANDERRSMGAEDSDYQALDDPYPCRNGPLRTLGELSLIIGWEDVTELRLPEDGTKFLDYLTVGPTGGDININTASRVVLKTLDPEIDDSLAEGIIALREETPFEDIQSLLLVQGMTQAIFQRISDHVQVKSNLFHVDSEGLFRKASSRLHVQLQRSKNNFIPIRWRVD